MTRPKKTAVIPEATPEKRKLKPHELVLSPMVQSAVGIEAWGKFAGTVDLAELLEGQREQFKQVQAGDMQPVEAMLYGQAKTLETIFTSLARRAVAQEHLKQFQTHLMLALKAQAQCRATLEALAEIKNPRPVAFVKQANISGGHQQVNNGPAPQASEPHAHAGNPQIAPNELLEQQHGNWLDIRAQGAAVGADSHLAPVEEVNRTTNG